MSGKGNEKRRVGERSRDAEGEGRSGSTGEERGEEGEDVGNVRECFRATY